MKMKLPLLFVLSMLFFAGTAGALETDGLIAITAMPLAVADVIALPEVPQDEVISVVTTLNRAAVPAPQFVEIVRYVPVALLEPAEPRFVTYVTQEYERGIVGEPLALSIGNRYDAYGIDDVEIVNPPVMMIVERREILPPVVVTRFQPVELDPLALIAMPLAVAAVADLTDVPQSDLMQFVASLNRALVPAPQFVEVVRYSPVVLVDRTAAPSFLQFVTTEVDRGVIGRPLAFAIANRIETLQPIDIDVLAPQPQLIVDRDEILPAVVVTRVAQTHPHGGAPGQLKKQLGLQTGAEVVHGSRPRAKARVTHAERAPRAETRVRKERVGSAPKVKRQVEQRRPETVRVSPSRSRGNSGSPVVKQHGGGNKRGEQPRGNSGGGKGQGQGKGKGKGKG
jgi:hypothetical protein